MSLSNNLVDGCTYPTAIGARTERTVSLSECTGDGSAGTPLKQVTDQPGDIADVTPVKHGQTGTYIPQPAPDGITAGMRK